MEAEVHEVTLILQGIHEEVHHNLLQNPSVATPARDQPVGHHPQGLKEILHSREVVLSRPLQHLLDDLDLVLEELAIECP